MIRACTLTLTCLLAILGCHLEAVSQEKDSWRTISANPFYNSQTAKPAPVVFVAQVPNNSKTRTYPQTNGEKVLVVPDLPEMENKANFNQIPVPPIPTPQNIPTFKDLPEVTPPAVAKPAGTSLPPIPSMDELMPIDQQVRQATQKYQSELQVPPLSVPPTLYPNQPTTKNEPIPTAPNVNERLDLPPPPAFTNEVLPRSTDNTTEPAPRNLTPSPEVPPQPNVVPTPKPNVVPTSSNQQELPPRVQPIENPKSLPPSQIPVITQQNPTESVSNSPWVVRVEIVNTGTHLIARSKNAEFRVVCQSLKMQSPSGNIQAEGHIKIGIADMMMQCDRLVISWQQDWVRLEGNVLVTTQKNGQLVQMSGEALNLKLTSLDTNAQKANGIDTMIQRTSFEEPKNLNIPPLPNATPSSGENRLFLPSPHTAEPPRTIGNRSFYPGRNN